MTAFYVPDLVEGMRSTTRPQLRYSVSVRTAIRVKSASFCAFVTLTAVSAAAQTAPTGGHVHYTAPAGQQTTPEGALAPRLQNLGNHVFPVSTRNRDAQRFMNQGLNLAYAFNHAEARRAFREAARLDPELAMAYWGQALVLGPNINASMDSNEEPAAYELIQKAISLKGRATAREQAYIDALAQRYSGRAEDRRPRDEAYATAMRAMHRRFPQDLDATMLYVESMMDLRPWGYWQGDGRPHEGTAEIVALTEQMLARNPRHPGALHMYIHLMESTSTPEKAERAADTLLTLMPAAGHMVHMPGHIYQRVGRYADAIRSNQLAIAADEDYIAQCRAQGIYPTGYYPHNIHFLWFAATFDGQSRLAIDSARALAAKIDDEALKAAPMTAGFRLVPYYALTRFGRWEEMLREPEPPANAVLRAAWHYTRGLSLVATGRADQAESELSALRTLMSDESMKQPLFSPNTAGAALAAAPEVLAAEIAASRRDYDRAIALLDKAVRLEDSLIYTEPAEFHFPPRHALGAILLEAGRPAEAETVYWEDLKRNRENGWALFGLLQALRAQDKADAAALVEARFKAAWVRADVTLTASRFGRPANAN
jgi:tetratricopeptide (TPR) repeat protein